MMKLKRVLGAMILVCISAGAWANAKEGFPGRTEFPDLPYLEKEQLFEMRDKVVIVDARSKYEFETLRIKNAINIPVASKSFEDKVKELRKGTNKKIVFYCNGRTCFKSYHAVKRSLAAGVKDTYSYDAGVFEWATAYPKEAVLLGENPIDVAKIIPKKIFKARLLDPLVFNERVYEDKNVMVLDVRDKYQREGIGLFPGKERWASLDHEDKVVKAIKKAMAEGKTLLIYDAVGKQVRWLQYLVEKTGLKNYYFMKKGVGGYYKDIIMADAKKS